MESYSKWGLAVQDWKSIGENRILAGGVDKSPDRDRSQPRAVVELIDIESRRRIAQTRLPTPARAREPVTREGLAIFNNRVFLVPADIGRGAEILRYRWVQSDE